MRGHRGRGQLAGALALLVAEGLLLYLLAGPGARLGSVGFTGPGRWLASVSPGRALAALSRLLGLAGSAWLLATTLVYLLASLTGHRRLALSARRLSPPVLRRLLDTVAAATVVASSLAATTNLVRATGPAALDGEVLRAPSRTGAPGPAGPGPAGPAASAGRGVPGGTEPARPGPLSRGRHLPHPGQHPWDMIGNANGATGPAPGPAGAGAGLSGAGLSSIPVGARYVVVRPGQCLSVIAQEHLGDWRRDLEIVALNRGRLQPDGRRLEDDHWVYAGWVLVMPPDAVGVLTAGAPPGGLQPAGEAARLGGAPVTAAASPGPAAPGRAGGSGAPPGAHRGEPGYGRSRHERPVVPPLPPADHRRGPRRPGPDGGIGALAAAGVVWCIDRNRRELMHARPRGRVIVRGPADVEGAVARARAVAAPEALAWVDLGLRYLGALAGDFAALSGPEQAPDLVAVRCGGAGLEVLLSRGCGARLGWFSAVGDGWYRLDADIELVELAALAEQRWHVWPAVAVLGQQPDGVLLFNLEHAGSISIEGEQTATLLGSVALGLAAQPWSKEMLAGTFVFGARAMPDQAGQGAGQDEAGAVVERLAAVSAAHTAASGAMPLYIARRVAAEALPRVALCHAGTGRDEARVLLSVSAPQVSGVVTLSAVPGLPGRWRLRADEDCSIEGEVEGRPVRLTFRLPEGVGDVAVLGRALELEEDVGRATAPAELALAERLPVLSAPTPGTGAAAGAGAEVAVLGPVEVRGAQTGQVASARRMAALGLLAYLALHRRPVTAEELSGALWPLDRARDTGPGPQRKTVMNVISLARALVGYGSDGSERVVYTPLGYRLAPDVSCDLWRFERLVARSRNERPEAACRSLRQALEMVQGEPFAGTQGSQFFDWVAAEHLDLLVTARVVDTAQDLAELALSGGDLVSAEWAVGVGLGLDPVREELYRVWLQALGRQGRPAKADEVYRRLALLLRQRVHPLQEPQPATRETWAGVTGRLVAASGAGHLRRTGG